MPEIALIDRDRQKAEEEQTQLTVNRRRVFDSPSVGGYVGSSPRRLDGASSREVLAERRAVEKASTGGGDNCISCCPLGTWDI
ncbi:hypothetical protein Q5P01_018254 [Channa striata]|uniref:Uncharacterized protein n=1 Tax=Channa striata TaxID=64152 RepID=A0AA88M7G4_CHASR|nr:hypothetical protein Q5P01_018254 [Channa striata]